jgi:hypothetical protein
MKRPVFFSRQASFPEKTLILLVSALFPCVALSDFDIAQRPLVVEKSIDPNLVYIHDDSGSMAYTFMPEDAVSGGPLRAAPLLNGVYYNPDITYQPPLRHDGTRLVRLRNSDRITSWPTICRDGYVLAVRNGGNCSGQTTTMRTGSASNAVDTAIITGTGAAVAAYWDYVPGYNSMRDNPYYEAGDPYLDAHKPKPEDDQHNYEYWFFRSVPSGELFRRASSNVASGWRGLSPADAIGGTGGPPAWGNRTQSQNQTAVRNRACPTIFREIADGKDYYGGMPSSTGAYAGTMKHPVYQLASQPERGGIAHAHCRQSYRVWDVDEPGTANGYGSTGTTGTSGYYYTDGSAYFPGPLNLPNPRSRFCTTTIEWSRQGYVSSSSGTRTGVFRPWASIDTTSSTAMGTVWAITCWAGRHAIGDTTGEGYWSAYKDDPDNPVSHFEYNGHIYHHDTVSPVNPSAPPNNAANAGDPRIALRSCRGGNKNGSNGVCHNLDGAEQGRLHLIRKFVNDEGDLVTEDTPRRRTSREEIRNFMNWYTYYRTRSMAAKGGMSIAFARLVDWENPYLPGAAMKGQSVRLGYDTINSGSLYQDNPTNRGPGQNGSNKGGIGVVPFRDFPANAVNDDGTPSPYRGQKFVKRFYDWVLNLPASGVTPLSRALNTTGSYFRTSAPWKEYPPMSYVAGGNGGTGEIYGCRRSFAILMTDGYNTDPTDNPAGWNPVNQTNRGDLDCATSLPRIEHKDKEGKLLSAGYQYTRQSPFCGENRFGGNYTSRNSLADIAMYYWATDLLPNAPNQLATTKKNPAFWQHMQTFTIGLGVEGRLSEREVNNFLADPDKVANKNILWFYPHGLNTNPERIDDLMHAGLNGHGGTVAAADADEFAAKLSALLTEIAGTPSSTTGYSGSGGRLNQANMLFRTFYNPVDWTGSVTGTLQTVCSDPATVADGSCVVGKPKERPEWEASAALTRRLTDRNGNAIPAGVASRRIFTWDGGVGSGAVFDASLPGNVKSAIDAPLDRSGGGGTPVWDTCPIPRANPEAACLVEMRKTQTVCDVDLGMEEQAVMVWNEETGEEEPTGEVRQVQSWGCRDIEGGAKAAYDVDLLINYLRGDRTWEDATSAAFTGQTYFGFRNRRGGVDSDNDGWLDMFFLGDIVYSNAYVHGNYRHNDAGYGSFNCGSDGVADRTADSTCEKRRAFFSVMHVNSYQQRAAALHGRGLSGNPKTSLSGTTVFVGANDGMLHAFDALDGKELFAYVPAGVHGKLKQLADPEYDQKHTWFVDGSPFVRDVLIDGEWRAVLVGHTGRGGRSFFALDVEDPANFSEGNVLWEITGNDHPDLGFPADGEGVITPVEGLPNKWGVIFGNGYNSANHDACLFAVELRKSPDVRRICVGEGGVGEPNGLGVPVWVDTDSNGAADLAYAGDALGNLWKFDLRSMTVGNGGQPLLKATAPDDKPQPITARPLPIVLKGDGSYTTLQLVTGTGKYFEHKDVSGQGVQSIYGVRDLSPSAASGTANRSNLMARSHVPDHPDTDRFCGANPAEDPDSGAKTDCRRYDAWKIATEDPDAPDYGASQMGYVIDFNAPGMKGFLVRAQGTILNDNNEGENSGLVPFAFGQEEDPCTSNMGGGIAEINLETGAWVKSFFFDWVENDSDIYAIPGLNGSEINRDGKGSESKIRISIEVDGEMVNVALMTTSNAQGVEMEKQKLSDQTVVIDPETVGDIETPREKFSGRRSWWQVR